MHKKLESELISIAHSILQMKNREDVIALKNKAKDVYERLAVLEFVDRFVETTPTNTKSKEEILEKVEAAVEIIDEEVVEELSSSEVKEELVAEEVAEELSSGEGVEKLIVPVVDEGNVVVGEVEELSSEEIVEELSSSEVKEKESKPKKVNKKKKVAKEAKEEEKPSKEVIEEDVEEVPDLFSTKEETSIAKKKNTSAKKTLEEELKDTIAVDVATDIFEKAVRVETPKKSLNDSLQQSNIQIGLNDRIAFVKHLFGGSQEDFNRVVSQLNSFKTEKEAKKFISKMVKPDYDWSEKEEYEERFITLITRKFA